MRAPTATVVTIFLDQRRFLGEAVESVLAQTLEDWELLLVDDGSRDGSTELARGYASREPGRIRYLSHPGGRNRGMSASRNLGIAQARGRYVAFLDSDDVLLPQALSEEVALLDAHPDAAMACGRALYWHSWNGESAPGREDRYDRPTGGDTARVVPPPRLLPSYLEEGRAPCICSILVRRSVLEELGGFETRFRGLYEDQVLYAKVALRYGIVESDACWSRYRQHPQGACLLADARGQIPAARGRYLRWLASYVETNGRVDPEVASCLERMLASVRGEGRLRSSRVLRAIVERDEVRAVVGFFRSVASAARKRLPRPLVKRSWTLPVGGVDLGDLRSLEPVSRHWGFDRGRPVDRYYIEGFLARHSQDVRGRVLEVGDDAYTRRFGGEAVSRRDVLHVRAGVPGVTVVADLTDARDVESDAFDCIILTQTLHLLYDFRAAMRTLHRILRPGGVLLLTVPGITPTTDEDWRSSWFWSFTPASLGRLAGELFPPGSFHVESHGNVLSATAFVQGLAYQELAPEELAHNDPDYPVTVALRAVKPAAAP